MGVFDSSIRPIGTLSCARGWPRPLAGPVKGRSVCVCVSARRLRLDYAIDKSKKVGLRLREPNILQWRRLKMAPPSPTTSLCLRDLERSPITMQHPSARTECELR